MMSAAFDSKFGSSLLDPVLPLSPGRAERHGFEYYRHGTLSLYALDTQSGKVLDKTAARYTSQEFVEFLTEVVERPPAREVHNILDNLSAHKSQVVRDFLAYASERAFRLHADVFVVAESSRDLVFQARARRDCSRNLWQREGSGPQASPLYQRLLSER
jgi:DDE superfamily endonuclease